MSGQEKDWRDDPQFLEKFEACELRARWRDELAEKHLKAVLEKLPVPLRRADRIGPLIVDCLPQSSEKFFWMLPFDGSIQRGKILGRENQVKVIDETAQILFEGKWGEVPRELIEKTINFYLWLQPPERK